MEIPRKKPAAATTKQAGDDAEDRALAHLQASGLEAAGAQLSDARARRR
jgi:hypothetical protein